jgi:hypothetical protein
LTRRANHWQNDIIAKVVKPARRKSVAGFFFEIPESDGGRPARRHISQRLSPGRRGLAVVRTFTQTSQLAGTRERAGLRRGSSPPHAVPDGIRFAPQMVCARTATMPHILDLQVKPMTAYLIALALVGLVVIAVSEECS